MKYQCKAIIYDENFDRKAHAMGIFRGRRPEIQSCSLITSESPEANSSSELMMTHFASARRCICTGRP